MVSRKLVAAVAAFSLLTGSGASPCKPSSSVSDVATSTLVSVGSSTTTGVSLTAASTSTEIGFTTAVSATTASIPEPTSYLLNGNFDTDPATFSPWALWYGPGMTFSGESLGLDYTKSHRGPRSLRISPGLQALTYLAQTIDKTRVKPDAKYEFSVWLQVSSAAQCTRGASIVCDYGGFDEPAGDFPVAVSGEDMAAGWKQVKTQCRFPQRLLDGAGMISAFVLSFCNFGATVWVDSMSLTEIVEE